MRIALLSTHSCPWAKPGNRYTGGMNIYIQNLARQLALHGHLADIYTSTHTGEEQCMALQMEEGVRLIHLNAADFKMITESTLQGHVIKMAAAIRSFNMEERLRYDLIHSHYWLSGMVGNLLKKSWEIPHVTMFHTLAALKNSSGLQNPEPDYRINCEKEIVDVCDTIIASTSRERHDLATLYNCPASRISVVPCGIDPSLFKPVNREMARAACDLADRPTLIFVGRMDPLKGLANLLEAISQARKGHDFQLLVIGGEGNDEAEFRHMLDLMHDYSIDDIVIPVGSVPHEQMYLYYNAADFCVIPSYYESFSLVALECLACGTPILATDVGAVRNIAEANEGCMIMQDNSPSTIANGIEAMLKKTKGKMDTDISNLVGVYGWESVSGRIIRIYQDMLLSSRLQPSILS